MVDQLQERIEREARFNSDVSHELRSPLTTLAAALEVLEADRDKLPPRSQRALQLLSDDLRRFQRMVGDLLEMSRADAGSVDVFLEEVNVSELVQRSVVAGFGHMDGHGGGAPPTVRVDPGVQTWRVGVDKRRFERVMVNLMENASHYGGGVTEIAVGPGEGDQVEVTVDDAGPGIEPQERSKVFERFYRGSASGRRGTGTGTGLGLALVAEHMRVMDGAVRVEASPRRRPLRPVAAGAGRRRRAGRRGMRRRLRRARRAGAGVPRGGLRHPDPGGAELHPTLEGALQPPEPAPADDDHDAAQALSLRAGQGLLPQLEQSAATGAAGASRLPPRSRPSSRRMLAGPTTAETASGVFTAIPSDVAVLSTTSQGGVVTVNMNSAFGQITGTSTELAVAQIVATVAAENGLGTGVIFEIEGQRTSVPIANGSQVTGPVYLIEFLSVAP